MEFGQNLNVTVMYAKPYSMIAEDTGEKREGLSVEYYFFGNDGDALKPVVDAGSGELGIRRSKCSMPIETKEKLAYVPGVYNGKFEMTVGADGKPVLKLVDMDFVGKCIIGIDPDDAAKWKAANAAGKDEAVKDDPLKVAGAKK